MKQQKHRLPVDHYILHMNHDQTIDVDLRHIAHVIDSCWRDAPCLQILNEFYVPAFVLLPLGPESTCFYRIIRCLDPVQCGGPCLGLVIGHA